MKAEQELKRVKAEEVEWAGLFGDVKDDDWADGKDDDSTDGKDDDSTVYGREGRRGDKREGGRRPGCQSGLGGGQYDPGLGRDQRDPGASEAGGGAMAGEAGVGRWS